MNRPILPVILSGGAGSRLWPMSRQDAAKQFLPLNSHRTMIQETADRFTGEAFLPPVFICNAAHVATIQSQIDDIGAIIVEPVGRNTAPCAVIAALHAQAEADGALVVLAPADHVIDAPDSFVAAINQAAPVAASGHHVTFGMTPDHPATGFGYIQQGEPISDGLFAIVTFREKPDRATATDYLDAGGYHWNSGIFLFNPDLVLNEMQEFASATAGPAIAAYENATRDSNVITLAPSDFADCKPEPIDIALMERTSKGAVLPCSMGWKDIGSFAAFRDLHAEDDAPVIRGDGFAHDSDRSLIDTDGPLVTLVGLENVGVIVREGRVLVVDLDASQDVKAVVNHLKSADRTDLL